MKVLLKDAKEKDHVCEALVLPLLEAEGMRPYEGLDRSLEGLPGRAGRGEFSGKHNEVFLLHTYGKIRPERVLLIGLGKRKEVSRERLRQAGGKASSHLRGLGLKDIAFSTASISRLRMRPLDFLEGCLLSQYRFGAYKKEEDMKGLRNVTVLSGEDLRAGIRWTETVVAANHFARDLVNTPANDMTPSALAKAARSLKGVTVKVIEKKEAERLGMGAYLSVARGSMEPPRFIVLTYRGKDVPPLALVGKSITFDSGGISLKPSEGMEKMKYDMAGGAAVLGVMKAASEAGLPISLLGVLPAAENLPGGSASRPGDVARSIGGKTIEIVNTDAEGRLALADAIGYVKRFKPEAIIDIATLTGACSVALGNEAMAMMGNDERLIEAMGKAAEETSERVWRMPLYDEYREYIESDIADLKNTSGKSGSLVTAGYFLKEFAGQTPWVHLDIAGTAWTEKDRPYIPKGATGIGVRLLLSFLMLYKYI
jgi:leucyl aminopeptidase